ncbi:hypothetical protein K505DRAFT_344358, partial [Melanomma pulvis-pyrius CBS 109.77]
MSSTAVAPAVKASRATTPLTYARLLVRLEEAMVAIAGHYPSPDDGARVKEIQNAISRAIAAAKAAMQGDKDVMTPGNLKYQVTNNIKEIHEKYDAAEEASLSEAAVSDEEGDEK